MTTIAEPILHVDMDSFFVEVERLRRPELRGVPVVVGGGGNRGVVASASYEARRYGVHSAMPTAHARRLCPSLRVVPADHARYREVSAAVFEVLASVTPTVEALSLDEAFLDVAGLRFHHRDAGSIASGLRARLGEELGLPASVGAATTKFVAKLASEAAKPDGVLVVPAGRELAFLHPLPVRALWGVGEAAHAALERLGVGTIGELATVPVATLQRRLGNAMGRHLADLADGIDPRPVQPHGEAKSVSVEHTYERDLTGQAVIERELLHHSDRLVGRLRRARLAARTITLKVRFSDFETFTRSVTLPTPVDLLPDVSEAVRGLLDRAPVGNRPVRLLGVGAAGLVDRDAPRQLRVDRGPEWERVAGAVDAIRARFGEETVGPARLVRPDPPGSGPQTAGGD